LTPSAKFRGLRSDFRDVRGSNFLLATKVSNPAAGGDRRLLDRPDVLRMATRRQLASDVLFWTEHTESRSRWRMVVHSARPIIAEVGKEITVLARP